MCHEALADGVSGIVAMGGDGTVHIALQAVAGTSAVLGIVPVGTGNDMAAGFGVPGDPVEAAERIVAGQTRVYDLARLESEREQRWYGGVMAAGFDAIVNERGNAMRWPKGPRRYDIAILVELARLKAKRYQLTMDGVAHEIDAVLLAVGNIPCYGGGMRICPDADPTDGKLDVVWAEPVSRSTLIRIKPRVYKGTHIEHPKVKQARVRQIRIDATGIVCYADGERIAPLPVTVTAVPGALTVLG
jgi:diacylglycerol kinase (ATP)